MNAGAALRATFVYPNPRRDLIARHAAGTEPDSILLGANHLGTHGINANVHDLLLTRRTLRPPLDRLAWNARELLSPFELGRTDLVFTPLANALPLAAGARRLPVVVVNYGLNVILRRASKGRRALLSRSLRSAVTVICLGESQRAELVDETGLPAERSSTMLLPIDEVFFTPRSDPAEDGTVLTVGKDLARDFRTFVDAVRPLGVRAMLAVYPRNLEGIELPPYAEARRLSSLELRDAYARASCVVLPQRRDDYVFGSEGGGLTALLEAMAMAKPIVVTERAILRDYVEHGINALVVPAEDPAALRAAIEQLLGDPELARRLGQAARERVEHAHGTRGFAARLAPVLRSAVAR